MSQPLEAPIRRFSVEEYLDRETAAEVRHEYHDGEILAMSGGTYSHSVVITNLLIALGSRLRGAPCRPLESNMRFRIDSRNRYVYPDVTVVCGPPQFDPRDRRQTTLLNPRVVFEVLSDSTQAYDRGEKFDAYRTIASIEEYVLITPDRPLVESYLRQADGSWRLDAYDGLQAVAKLRSLSIDVPLAEIYLDITFPPPSTPAI